MLSNAYFLAKVRFDTAENEPAKNLQNFRKMHFSKMHFSKMHFSKICKFLAGSFSAVSFFFKEEARPRVETEGMTLPQPPEGTGQKCHFCEKRMKKKVNKKFFELIINAAQ